MNHFDFKNLSCYCFVAMAFCFSFNAVASIAKAAERPNVVWLTSEDNGPQLGCYGDTYADTPNLDRLAKKGMLYRNCWSNAPVCAPARTTLITGVYPTAMGAEHMRSMLDMPKSMKMYPQYLREAGYYCTNNSKEDYNLNKPGQVWDASSRKAHWKNRKKGQPFFAIFNDTVSHESKIRMRPHTQIHDPKKVTVPAYHPDTPEVRQDWAQYYDKMTEMDRNLGRKMKELEEAGLLDETIIFYYGDHGSGMPRSKRWPYNSGLSVPLIVVIPEKYQHLAPKDYTPGGETNRLVAFVDFAPTLLSLAGIKPPEYMQGNAFLGKHTSCKQDYLFGFRGRMDERCDMVRTVRDQRYVYIRNYNPHKIQGQYLDYMFKTPTTRIWRKMFDEGKLNAVQSFFWKPKPAEELYDLTSDADEVVNLANLPAQTERIKKFRDVLHKQTMKIRDLGFLPELEIHKRAVGSSPYDVGQNRQEYDLETIVAMAEIAASRNVQDVPKLLQGLKQKESAVRYWAVLGFVIRGEKTVQANLPVLRPFLKDTSNAVKIVACEALGRYGTIEDKKLACQTLIPLAHLKNKGVYSAIAALNALDTIDVKVKLAYKDQIIKLPKRNDKELPRRLQNYTDRLLTEAAEKLNQVKSFRRIEIPKREHGYGNENLDSLVIRTEAEWNSFLAKIRKQPGWNNRKAFEAAVEKAKIDFTKEAFVLLRHTEGSGSIKVMFEKPSVQGTTLNCKIANPPLKEGMMGTADMAYYGFAIVVSKAKIKTIALQVKGKKALVLSVKKK